MRLPISLALLLLMALAPSAAAQRRSELPTFQVYDGARRPEAEVARLHVRTTNFGNRPWAIVQRVAGEGVVWSGASVWPFGQNWIQGPLLGQNIAALELAPGEYDVTVAYWHHQSGAVLGPRTVRLNLAPGRSYRLNADARWDGRSFNIMLRDEASDETLTFEP